MIEDTYKGSPNKNKKENKNITNIELEHITFKNEDNIDLSKSQTHKDK